MNDIMKSKVHREQSQQQSHHALPETGFVRLTQIIGDGRATPPIPPIIPVSRSGWWHGVKEGRYPKPVKLSKRCTAWRVEDIRQLIDELSVCSD